MTTQVETKQQIQHTPTPLRVIVEQNGVEMSFRPQGFTSATQLVRAVNAHERLVDALVKIMGGYGEPVSAEIARAALAEVQGE